MSRKKYFTYAILAYDGKGSNEETVVLQKPTTILEASTEAVQVKAVRQLTSEQFDKYGLDNIDIMIKPF